MAQQETLLIASHLSVLRHEILPPPPDYGIVTTGSPDYRKIEYCDTPRGEPICQCGRYFLEWDRKAR